MLKSDYEIQIARVADFYQKLSAPTPEARQFRRDEKARARHIREGVKEFRKLAKTLTPYADMAKQEHPGRDKLSIKRRGMAFTKAVKALPMVTAYLDQYVGTKDQHPSAYSWRATTIRHLRNAHFKHPLRESAKAMMQILSNGFESMTMAEAQAPLRKALPEQIREFLPKNIVVEVDENNVIKRITDRFENKNKTLAIKIKTMHKLIRDYNKIAKRVKQDLKSNDEVTRLAALITAILMETGIRPGKMGNQTVKTINGEKIVVETFGAITLGPAHVKFIRDNFAELEFIGKKSTVNTAALSNAEIIKILQDYVTKAKTKGSKFVFVTDDGERFSYANLDSYFKKRFKGVDPTDFRKLKATEEVLAALRDEQVNLYQQIRNFAEHKVENLKEKVVEIIVNTINTAIDKAATALSHVNRAETQKSYINPEIVFRFLSQGRVEDTLDKAILQGTNKLLFDPQKFIDQALAKAASVQKQGKSLLELMEELEVDLGEAGVRVAAVSTPRPVDVAMRYLRRG